MPWIVADTACDEVGHYLEVEMPRDRYAEWLDAKAERCYARNRRFRKLMHSRGNAPREWLLAFMQHWLAALLQIERPDLLRRLPWGYGFYRTPLNGLGPKAGERMNTGLRPWDPQRVLRHPSWRWLAENASAWKAPNCQL